MDADQIRALSQILKLLSHETRLRILSLLARCEQNVMTMSELLVQGRPSISSHLALLRVTGLVDFRREAKGNVYAIIPDRIRVASVILSGLVNEQLVASIGENSMAS